MNGLHVVTLLIGFFLGAFFGGQVLGMFGMGKGKM